MYDGIERPDTADPIEVIELDRPAGTGEVGFATRLGRRPVLLRIAALAGAAGALVLAAALTMAASPSPSPTAAAGATPGSTAAPAVPGPWGGRGMMGPGRGMDRGWAKGFLRGQPGLGAITIVAIDGSSLSLKTADGWIRTITVSSSTTITKGGQAIHLGDLRVGDQIRFQETRGSDGTFSITAIEVVLPQISGTVGALTSNGFTVKAADGSTTTVVITSSTTYQLGRGSATRADVEAGLEVVVQGSRNSDGSITATAVRISPATVAGQVTAKTSTTITVRLPGGTTTTVRVSAATTYRIPGKSPASLADVTVGMRIVAQGTVGADGTLQATAIGAMSFGGGMGPFGGGMGPSGGPFNAPSVTGGSGTQG